MLHISVNKSCLFGLNDSFTYYVLLFARCITSILLLRLQKLMSGGPSLDHYTCPITSKYRRKFQQILVPNFLSFKYPNCVFWSYVISICRLKRITYILKELWDNLNKRLFSKNGVYAKQLFTQRHFLCNWYFYAQYMNM